MLPFISFYEVTSNQCVVESNVFYNGITNEKASKEIRILLLRSLVNK